MLAEIVNVVGGEFGAVFGHCAVTAEVDDQADDFAGPPSVARGEDADFFIDRTGRADDLRVELTGMRDLAAIAHEEAAVEMNAPHAAEAGAELAFASNVPGIDDSRR